MGQRMERAGFTWQGFVNRAAEMVSMEEVGTALPDPAATCPRKRL